MVVVKEGTREEVLRKLETIVCWTIVAAVVVWTWRVPLNFSTLERLSFVIVRIEKLEPGASVLDGF